MIVKLNDLVKYDSRVTTINELDKQGLIEFKKVENFHTKRGIFTKYFADIKTDTKGRISIGWEISKFAYLSKTGEEIII